MSVVPRVKNNGLYLGFLSLLSQTVHSSPTWCEELTYLKRPWCWERLRAGGEGDDRGWDGWMASPTQWTWVWMHSRSWWWTGRPGVLCFMGSQRVRHDWVTELNYSTSLELQAFFTPTPPHTPLFPFYLWALSHLWAAAPGPGQKSLDAWPGSRAYMEREFPGTPERCGSQWDCQRRCSRPWPHWRCLQQQENTHWQREVKSPSCTTGCSEGKKQTKYLVLQSSLLWSGEGTPFASGTNGEELACQCRRHKRCRFGPWVGEILSGRKWQPTPVFLPGESHGQRSLVGYSPWDRKELDVPQATLHSE